MICPCTLGGLIAGCLGISSFERVKEGIVGAVITAILVKVTTIALKVLLNFSLCGSGEFNLQNMVRMGILGIPYSIAVNYLLRRYVFPENKEKKQENLPKESSQHETSCCQHKKGAEDKI